MSNQSKDKDAGTIEQRPTWEGPPSTRPRGYKPERDDRKKVKDEDKVEEANISNE